MKVIARRLLKLEQRFAPKRNERELALARMVLERRCQRLAKERGVPFEQVLSETLIERKAFWATYVGDGTVADILRFARRRRVELSQADQKAGACEDHR